MKIRKLKAAEPDLKSESDDSSEIIELSFEEPDDKKCLISKTDFQNQTNYTGRANTSI